MTAERQTPAAAPQDIASLRAAFDAAGSDHRSVSRLLRVVDLDQFAREERSDARVLLLTHAAFLHRPEPDNWHRATADEWRPHRMMRYIRWRRPGQIRGALLAFMRAAPLDLIEPWHVACYALGCEDRPLRYEALEALEALLGRLLSTAAAAHQPALDSRTLMRASIESIRHVAVEELKSQAGKRASRGPGCSVAERQVRRAALRDRLIGIYGRASEFCGPDVACREVEARIAAECRISCVVGESQEDKAHDMFLQLAAHMDATMQARARLRLIESGIFRTENYKSASAHLVARRRHVHSGSRSGALHSRIVVNGRELVPASDVPVAPPIADGCARAAGGSTDIATKSVFDSPPEQDLYAAVVQAYPNHLVVPNYALQSLLNYDRMKERLNRGDFNYFLRSRVDVAVISTADYKPLFVLEWDSGWHDSPRQQRRDASKDRILAAAGLAFVRLRARGSLDPVRLRAEVACALEQLHSERV